MCHSVQLQATTSREHVKYCDIRGLVRLTPLHRALVAEDRVLTLAFLKLDNVETAQTG